MVICHQGSMVLQGDSKQKLTKGAAAVFKLSSAKDEMLKFNVLEDSTRFIMLAGKPLNEPIAARGPFVLNEEDELYKAFDDYQTGRNGFEGALDWNSEIKNLPYKAKTV